MSEGGREGRKEGGEGRQRGREEGGEGEILSPLLQHF